MRWHRLVVAGAVLLAAKGVDAQERSAVDCPSASEEGQRLRDQSKYRAARERFRSCAQSACPALVRKDCVQWGAELDATMPTIVVGVVDEAARDMSEVELSVDGEMVASRVDGKPIAIDPGAHELRATASGRVPATLPLVVRVGEKNRLVQLAFAPKTSRAEDAVDTHAATRAGPPRERPRRSLAPPLASVVLGSVGVLGLGSFAAFGITSKSDLDLLRDTCAPGCAQSDLDGIKTRMLVADLSLGVGVVGLGLAAALWIHRATKPLPPTVAAWHVSAAPLPGGAAATVVASF